MSERTTLRILERDAEALERALFDRSDVESAAYLRCTVARQVADVVFLVREVIPVATEHYLLRNADGLSIAAESFIPVLKNARTLGEAYVFVHTHPNGPRAFSAQDDREEEQLFRTAAQRIPNQAHASIVFVDASTFLGRTYLPDGRILPLDRIVVIGRRVRLLLGDPDSSPLPVIFDRQVRAFGEDIQRLLRHLRVAIVGAGGTGSPLFEECLRLGVGSILVIEPDRFDLSNLNRVWNSRRSDVDRPKVEIIERTAVESGLAAEVRTICGSINDQRVARELVTVDVIFGCTDTELSRAILCRIATRYFIPVFDTGVVIASYQGRVTGVTGRITTAMPGTACLLCRERISAAMIRAESLPMRERQQLAAEGYAPELAIPNPAVIPFTTTVASLAVSELLHRVTGFMGARASTETLIQFDVPQIRSNSTPAEAWCDCAREENWGAGDETPFLGLSWPAAPSELPDGQRE